MSDKPKRKQKSTSNKKKQQSNGTGRLLFIAGLGAAVVIGFFLMFANSDDEDVVLARTEEPIPTLAIETLPPYERGLAYMDIGRYAEAALTLTTELEISPDNMDALAARADAYRLMGDLPSAINDYNRVLSQQPERDRSWYGLAQAYHERYRLTDEAIYLPDALEAARQTIQAAPGGDANTMTSYHRLMGDIAYDLEAFDIARDAYESYLSLTDAPSEQVTERMMTLP